MRFNSCNSVDFFGDAFFNAKSDLSPLWSHESVPKDIYCIKPLYIEDFGHRRVTFVTHDQRAKGRSKVSIVKSVVKKSL